MREKTKDRIKVIECSCGAEFEHVLNKAFDELSEERNFRFEIRERKEGHCAYLFWKEVERFAETARDQCELDGIRLYCGDCPKCERPLDKRKKWCECPLAPGGYVSMNESACEWFCREYLAGREKRRGE